MSHQVVESKARNRAFQLESGLGGLTYEKELMDETDFLKNRLVKMESNGFILNTTSEAIVKNIQLFLVTIIPRSIHNPI